MQIPIQKIRRRRCGTSLVIRQVDHFRHRPSCVQRNRHISPVNLAFQFDVTGLRRQGDPLLLKVNFRTDRHKIKVGRILFGRFAEPLHAVLQFCVKPGLQNLAPPFLLGFPKGPVMNLALAFQRVALFRENAVQLLPQRFFLRNVQPSAFGIQVQFPQVFADEKLQRLMDEGTDRQRIQFLVDRRFFRQLPDITGQEMEGALDIRFKFRSAENVANDSLHTIAQCLVQKGPPCRIQIRYGEAVQGFRQREFRRTQSSIRRIRNLHFSTGVREIREKVTHFGQVGGRRLPVVLVIRKGQFLARRRAG